MAPPWTRRTGARRRSRVARPEGSARRPATRIIGAAIEVDAALGPGYLESVYEEAICVELALRGIKFARQVFIEVGYEGQRVGEGRIDLLVEGSVVVELKSVDSMNEVHLAQALSYLKATGQRLALVINFNVALLRDGSTRRVMN